MPSKIRVLSDHTINKIAAGEVIENPASVVKELVENSLDAGSTDICIEIQGGGRQMIRISDNGCGMNPDDALLCLERHATSKLREVEEIHSLSTMGFRGEAIPSIASISKFNLLTCPATEEGAAPSLGTMVMVDGGKIISCNPAARSQGTTIEVKALFFNVPVRKKFLKSPSVDANEILKTVSLLALGYPEIKFQLLSDGKSLLMAPPSRESSFAEKLGSRIETVLGSDFLQNSSLIEAKKDKITLEGVIGQPSNTRHNRTGQYLFINRRAVVSPLVAYAVKEGFGTSIATGRFPVFVLHLSVDGDLVDVNVHPQKREVRLRQEQLIKELITQAVRSGISPSRSSFFPSSPTTNSNSAINPVFSEAFPAQGSSFTQDVPETWVFQPKAHFENPICSRPDFLHSEERKAVSLPSSAFPPQKHPYQEPSFKELSVSTKPQTHTASSLPFSNPSEEPLKATTTIPGYILLDNSMHHPFLEKGCRLPEKGGIILIDQKNAHSRILFEKLSQGQANQPIAQQTLLVPHTIELNSYESEILHTSLPLLNKMGIHIQEFGPNTFLIDAIPQAFGNSNIDILVADIIHDLRSLQTEHTNDQVIFREQAKRIAQAAARATVSCSRRLSLMEAQALLDQLIKCQHPYLCPSGKPIIAQITLDELAKLFQR